MRVLKAGLQRLHTRLTLLCVCIILPLSLFPFFVSLYAVNTIEANTRREWDSMLRIYADWTEDTLRSLSGHAASFALSDDSFRELALTQPTGEQRVLLAQSVYRQLAAALSSSYSGDAMFCYSPRHERLLLAVTRIGDEYAIRQALMDRMQDWDRDGSAFNSWIPVSAGGNTYFCYMLSYGKEYVGVLYSVSESLSKIPSDGRRLSLFYQDALIYTDPPEGEIADFSGELLRVEMPVAGEDYLLRCEIPARQALRKMGNFTILSLVMLLFGLGMMSIILVLLRKWVSRPLLRLVDCFEGVSGGNMYASLDEPGGSAEFQAAYDGFNEMMTKLRLLQADIYAEQSRRRRLELMQLQYQIKPHFFLNALNMIYHLAQTQQMEPIQRMALAMAEYFRYAFRTDVSRGPLGREFGFIRSYLEIQSLRYGSGFHFRVEADDAASALIIPTFSVATYTENACKHGNRGDGDFRVSVTAFTDPASDEVCITVQDNGPGFPPELLEGKLLDLPEPDETESHMGIRNMNRTFALHYGDRVHIDYDNAPEGGAIVRIYIRPERQSNGGEGSETVTGG